MSSLPWIGFYGFCLTAAILWIPPLRRIWPALAALTLGVLICAGLVFPLGALWLVSTALALFASTKITNRFYANASYGAGIVLVVALVLHLLPGFATFQLISPTHISVDSTVYGRRFGVDQAFAGLLFLAFTVPLVSRASEWMALLRKVFPIAMMTIAVVITFALLTHLVAFSPKWSPLFVTFALSNLFITAISEEIVFRGILQGTLTTKLRKIRYGAAIAIFVSGALFGLAHFVGGPTYMALATIAGIGYGYAYYATARIEAAILAHFALNLTHFVFFTYPSLA